MYTELVINQVKVAVYIHVHVFTYTEASNVNHHYLAS